MPLRDSGGCLGKGMEVHEDLISSLPLVEVVDGKIEIVRGDGALGALVHIR